MENNSLYNSVMNNTAIIILKNDTMHMYIYIDRKGNLYITYNYFGSLLRLIYY
jgi:hypothetical protein